LLGRRATWEWGQAVNSCFHCCSVERTTTTQKQVVSAHAQQRETSDDDASPVARYCQ
jgi:hypothetical protein